MGIEVIGLSHLLKGGALKPIRHYQAASAIRQNLDIIRHGIELQLGKAAGIARNLCGAAGGNSRCRWRNRRQTIGIDERQGDQSAGGLFARLPELRTSNRTVILEQAEATIRYRGTRHEAWSADDTGGHRWRYQGGVEGVLGEYRLNFRHVGLFQLDGLGRIDLDEAGHARDALQGAGQVLDLRQGGLGQHQAGGDEEDDAEHRDLDQRDDGRQILREEKIHAPIQHPGDDQAH